MTVPLFTTRGEGCRQLMDLHPALRDLERPAERVRGASTGAPSTDPEAPPAPTPPKPTGIAAARAAVPIRFGALFRPARRLVFAHRARDG